MARLSLKKNKRTKHGRTRRQRQRRRQMRGGDFLDYFKPTVKDAAYCQAEFDKCNASINPDSEDSIYPSFLTNLFGTKKDSTTSNEVEGEDQGIEMQEYPVASPPAEPAAEGDFTNDLASPLAQPAAEDDSAYPVLPASPEGDLDSNNNFTNDTLDTASPVLSPAAASPVLSPAASPAASPVLSPADDDLYSTIPINNDSIGKEDFSYSNNNNFTNNELASAQNKKLLQNKNQILSPSMVSPVIGGGGSRKKYKKRNANRSKKNKNRRNKRKTNKRT